MRICEYANMRIMRFAFRILFEKKEKTKKARKESNIKKRSKEKKRLKKKHSKRSILRMLVIASRITLHFVMIDLIL